MGLFTCYRSTLFLRFESRVFGTEGGTIQIYITGIKLTLPQNAVTEDSEINLSLLDSSSVPPIILELGESVLSDIVRLGPKDAIFKKEAELTIPHSLSDIPEHSSVVIKYFDAKLDRWVDQTSCSGLLLILFPRNKLKYSNCSILINIQQ